MTRKIDDLIDFEKVNLLLEGFNNATNFATAILDLDGNILSRSGWRQICTDFHRIHPETAKNCIISDTELTSKLSTSKKYHSFKCLNGLVDVAVPIMINSEHVGNLVSGQFFLEKPKRDFFVKQAEKYKFNSQSYLDALDKVPIVSEEKVKKTLDFLLNMTSMISEMSQQKVEQKKTEEALKSSEEKYKALFENAPLSYQSLDEKGRFIDVNPSWLRTLGYERDEVIGKFYADFLHPDWKAHFEKNFPAFKKRGYVHDVQFKLKHKKGHFIDISFEGCIGYLPDGSFKQTYCVFQDITERKKAENKLKMFSRVINHSLNPFDIVNPKGEFIYVNKAYADMWGYETTDEIIGTSPLSHCADKNLVGHIISEIKKNGKFISEIKAKRKDGSIFDVLMHARLDHDEDGNEIYPTTSLDITERKQAEKTIMESEERLRLALEINNTGAWELNLVDFTSKRTLVHDQTFGYETLLPVWTYEMFLEHVIPDDRDFVNKRFGKAIDTVSDWNFECRIKRPDGEQRWISAIGRHIVNSDGKPLHLSGVVQDITDRKNAEQALQQITERLQFATEGAHIGTWHWNTITGELIWSSVMKDLFDIPQEELMTYERFSQVLHPDDRDRTDERVKKALDNHSDFNMEYRCIWRDGSVHWRSALGKGFYDESGKNIRMEGVVIDINKQKNTEKALIESEQRLNEAQRMASIGYWILDVKSEKLIWSDETFRIFEVDKEFSGSLYDKFTALIYPEERETVTNAYKNSLETKMPYEITHKLQMPDGRIKYVQERCETEYDESGNPVKSVGTVQDVTKLKKAEEELKKHKENLEELVAKRTKELEQKYAELERMNRLFVGRELRMVELKKKIEILKKELKNG
jgi:PAS domain S-box-containing protein